jgi:hypothetical protein
VLKALGKDLFTLGGKGLPAKRRPVKGSLPRAFFRALGKAFAEGHNKSSRYELSAVTGPGSRQRIFQSFFT